MPLDRGAIEAQLREIGESERWWEHREFRELPNVLHAEERIQALTSGSLNGARRPRMTPGGRWLIVVTTQRLLCVKQERFARKQVDFSPAQIARIYQRSRLRTFDITIDTPLRTYRIRIPKMDALRFSGALGSLMAEPGAQEALPTIERAPAAPQLPAPSSEAPRAPRMGVVRRFTRRFSPDYVPREPLERMQMTVDRLQHDVERLQQRVTFLEDLLHKQSDEAFLARSAADS
jgi:Bacterial PH domain